ncbi:unnamed protein product [Acidithrix sp. C25]|nr:unnamed protein product [Acidithrix sp. C25]
MVCLTHGQTGLTQFDPSVLAKRLFAFGNFDPIQILLIGI